MRKQKLIQFFSIFLLAVCFIPAGIKTNVSLLSPTSHLHLAKVPFPSVVDWVITQECPIRCAHCFTTSKYSRFKREQKGLGKWQKPDELSLKEAKQLVDFLAFKGVKIITITGGEPLNRMDLVEILKYIQQKGMEVYLYTSSITFIDGVGLNRSKIDEIVPYIDYFHLSYDHYHAVEYAKYVDFKNSYDLFFKEILQYIAQTYPNLRLQIFTTIGNVFRKEGAGFISNDEYLSLIVEMEKFLFESSKGIDEVNWKLSLFRFNSTEMRPGQKKLKLDPGRFQQIRSKALQVLPKRENLKVAMNDSLYDYSYLFIFPNGSFKTTVTQGDEQVYLEIGSFREMRFQREEIWEQIRVENQKKIARIKPDILPKQLFDVSI